MWIIRSDVLMNNTNVPVVTVHNTVFKMRQNVGEVLGREGSNSCIYYFNSRPLSFIRHCTTTL